MPDRLVINLDALSDLRTPWCLHVVATLRIAEHVLDGKIRIEQLAEVAECDRAVLHAVLTVLVDHGVFEEPEPGRFEMNDAARGLLDPAWRLGLDLNGIGGRMAHAWGTLLPYVRTGRPAYSEVFGLPSWEDLEAHPEVAASFDALAEVLRGCTRRCVARWSSCPEPWRGRWKSSGRPAWRLG